MLYQVVKRIEGDGRVFTVGIADKAEAFGGKGEVERLVAEGCLRPYGETPNESEAEEPKLGLQKPAPAKPEPEKAKAAPAKP